MSATFNKTLYDKIKFWGNIKTVTFSTDNVQGNTNLTDFRLFLSELQNCNQL